MKLLRVLLVDDEAVDLEWMRRRVAASSSTLPLEVVGTASSGFQALSMLEEEKVDIILSDIRMPIMTGIEFVRRVRARLPDVKIVFISGHEDFAYAKEAISLHVSDYLLKPVQDEELYTLLAALCKKVEQEQEESRSFTEALSLVNEELLLRWFTYLAPTPVETHLMKLLEPMLQSGTVVSLLEIDDLEWKWSGSSEEEKHQTVEAIHAFIRQFIADRQLGLILSSAIGRFILLSTSPEDAYLPSLQELLKKISQEISVTLTIGVGQYAHDVEELHDSYRRAQAALSAKWLLGKNRVIQDAAESSPASRLGVQVEEKVEGMLRAIMNYDLVAIDDSLLDLFSLDRIRGERNRVYDLIVRITSKLHADLMQQNENLYELLQWEDHQPMVLYQFETVDDILSWLRRRFFELSELLYVKRQRQKRKLIDEIMRYVDEHLEQKITLKEVAAHFDFTPNYMGFLFKEEAGVHFTDYLIERRMNRVCELLQDPTLKIYEIAERVGYKNMIYFNRQFKQSIGMSPGEYRKKHKV